MKSNKLESIFTFMLLNFANIFIFSLICNASSHF